MDRPRVLLAASNPSQAYDDALTRAGFVPLHSGGVTLADEALDLAVVDCDLEPDAVVRTCAQLSERGVPVLLLVGDAIPPEGVGKSAGDVALKPLEAEALVDRLHAMLVRERHAEAPAGQAHVVSVFAPKGGVGKTTIAVNLAVALRRQTRSEVLLLDAAVGVGNASSVLRVPDQGGLTELAAVSPDSRTDAAFERITSTHPASGVRVLSWGTEPSDWVSVDLLLSALRWARHRHAYVIVDNHPGYDDWAMAMLAASTEVLLIVTPEVGALRNGVQFLELARELGLAQAIRVVVNRADHGIPLQEMANSLGVPIEATVVSSGPKAVIAANEGDPIVLRFPRDRITNDLHRVARLVTQQHGHGSVSTRPATRRWWMRFGPRMSEAKL